MIIALAQPNYTILFWVAIYIMDRRMLFYHEETANFLIFMWLVELQKVLFTICGFCQVNLTCKL